VVCCVHKAAEKYDMKVRYRAIESGYDMLSSTMAMELTEKKRNDIDPEQAIVVAPLFANGSSSTIFEESVAGEEEEAGHSSMFGAGFNFVNSIVGAGIVGMPVAIAESGFAMGMLLLILVAVLVDRSVIMLVECGLRAKKKNLEELCGHLLGPTGHNVATIFMFLYAYGAMIAYMVIIGDTVPVALNFFFGDGVPGKDAIILIAAVFIILPLSLLRDMSSLSYTSLLSITADFILIIFVLANGPKAAREEETEFESSDLNVINYKIFEGIGTFSFAFVCQHSTFIVFRTMKKQDLAHWTMVSHGSLTVAALMCLALGLSGYLSFGSHTKGDILNNFSEEDKLMLVGRLLLAITMVFTFPMECFVARHALVSVWQSIQTPPPSSPADLLTITPTSSAEDTTGQQMSTMTHVSVTLGLWSTTVAIAISFGDLRIVLAITGALAASMLGYILPALLYFKTYEVDFKKARLAFSPTSEYYQPRLQNRLRGIQKFLFPGFCLVFGAVALVIGVATVISEYV